MFNNLLATSSLFGLFLASRAFAGVYVTNPVADTTVASGQKLTINWVDDGIYPLLNSIGPSSIALYTGSSLQQTWLASIAEEVDVSRVGTIDWAVDPGVGPSGGYYFIRFTSKNLKSSTDAAFPHTAFSAKFTLENMSGTFNSTVLAQLNATSSASASMTGSSRPTGTGSGVVGTGGVMTAMGSSSSGSGRATESVVGGTMMSSTVRPTTTPATATASNARSSPSTSSPSSTTSTSSANSSNNAMSIGRELSHAGIGAVVVGCLGLGLALCL